MNENSQNSKDGLSMLGSAAKALLSKAATTVFNPTQAPAAPKPQNLNSVLQGIKPPDFSNRPIPAQMPKLNTSSYKPTIPTINLPDFKSIIPSIKLDK
jgi:hypothetical protein